VCLLLASAIAASAQVEIVPIEGRDAALAETGFKLAPSGSTMKCAIKPTVPELNFKLLYDAGFKMTFPLDPRLGPSRSLNIFLRVRSADAREKPAYLAARYRLPGGPLTDLGMLTGHFALTPGSWSVEALAVDSEGKVCRADWRTEIKSVPAPVSADSKERLRRLTILIDAAPVHQASGSIGPADLDMFLGSLSALLRFFPAQSTRVIVFNLDDRKELLHSDGVQPSTPKDVAAALRTVTAGTIDLTDLLKSPSEFLAALIVREIRDANDADLVVFIGPPVRDPVPPVHLAIPPDRAPPVVDYLQLKPIRLANVPPACGPHEGGSTPCTIGGHATVRLLTSVVPDVIREAVARLHGETVAVSDPTELADALKNLAHRVQAHRAKK
jgi:hypothetical protein